MIFDIDKISLKEAFNNDNGKTSANKIVGVTTSFICMILVISLIIFYFFNTGEATIILALIDKTITYFACAAALMGVKSFSNALWRKSATINNVNPYQPTSPTYQPPIQLYPSQQLSTTTTTYNNNTTYQQYPTTNTPQQLLYQQILQCQLPPMTEAEMNGC